MEKHKESGMMSKRNLQENREDVKAMEWATMTEYLKTRVDCIQAVVDHDTRELQLISDFSIVKAHTDFYEIKCCDIWRKNMFGHDFMFSVPSGAGSIGENDKFWLLITFPDEKIGIILDITEKVKTIPTQRNTSTEFKVDIRKIPTFPIEYSDNMVKLWQERKGKKLW